ncbi:unnamed protein product [Rotaria socialis]|uniref:Uncharacterized protein n=1 Tax=Rotaria socialis TaxID=392032 RepID=A0A817Y850_9BILA|nr:unnamed protein product [Rotaria socialis]
MGITGLDLLDSMAPHIPFIPINYDLANKCYIIIFDPTDAKNAHMGILIDLAGMSTDTEIAGILIHAIANTHDKQVPHSTDFDFRPWTKTKSEVVFKYVSELHESKYLGGNNNIQLPCYLVSPAIPANIHEFIANPMTPIILKQTFLHSLGSYTYFHMASQYQPIWSSSLGLAWPEDIAIAGGILPVAIDISILYMSSNDKVKTKKKQKQEKKT